MASIHHLMCVFWQIFNENVKDNGIFVGRMNAGDARCILFLVDT